LLELKGQGNTHRIKGKAPEERSILYVLQIVRMSSNLRLSCVNHDIINPRASTPTKKGKNPLNDCIVENDWKTAKEKLRTDPDLAEKWSISQSFSGINMNPTSILPLHQACTKTDVQIDFLESLILAHPAALNQCEKTNNRNPLHIAIKFHLPPEVIEYLLLKDPDAALSQDSFGRVPLHYACSNLASATTVRKLITAHPKTVIATDIRGWTPLHVASNHSPFLAVIETMLEFYPEAVVLVTKTGSTPIDCAKLNSSNDQESIRSLLLSERQKLNKLPLFKNMMRAENNAKHLTTLWRAPNDKHIVASFHDKKFQVHTYRDGQFV